MTLEQNWRRKSLMDLRQITFKELENDYSQSSSNWSGIVIIWRSSHGARYIHIGYEHGMPTRCRSLLPNSDVQTIILLHLSLEEGAHPPSDSKSEDAVLPSKYSEQRRRPFGTVGGSQDSFFSTFD
ncbi:hypothetical protein BDZ89DRAFT_1052903 [Hymenopellis radicata]|nr:hypothetical protein BDZ89DRAFT_1052903 [Hymenopellis radicata]